MAGHWLAGLWSAQVTRDYLLSLPGVLVVALMLLMQSLRGFARLEAMGGH